MRKFVYVDTENVGSGYINYLLDLDDTFTIHHIYTVRSANLDFEAVSKIYKSKANSKFIRTKNGIQNSLDFCLVADLAYNAAKHSEEDLHIILSRDSGYDSAIEFLTAIGFKVVRVDNLCKILEVAIKFEYDLDEYSYPNLSTLESSVSDSTNNKDNIGKALKIDGYVKSLHNIKMALRDGFFKKYNTCINSGGNIIPIIDTIINRNADLVNGSINSVNIIKDIKNILNIRRLRTASETSEFLDLIRRNKGNLMEIT